MRASHPRRARRTYLALSLAIAGLTLVGFARTFYLHDLFHVPGPRPLIGVHGAIMTGWVLLLAVQSILISRRRVLWHRRIGMAAAVYATSMVILGCAATLSAASRAVDAHSPLVFSQLDVLALELMQMLLFAAMFTAAIMLRNRPDFHKRVMVVATLCLLPNVVVRLVMLTRIDSLMSNSVLMAFWASLVIAVMTFDFRRTGRAHPAMMLAGSVAILGLTAAHLIGVSAGWQSFASRLVS